MVHSKLKKTAISSLALLMLAGGGTSAFADNGKHNGDKHGDKHGDKKNEQHHDKDKNKPNLNFKDEKELKWAMEHIMRLASKGVFNGYEDGTFKPHQTISRIETLVAAVRLMGLRQQAESAEEMKTELNFKDSKLIEKKYPWAVGYVAVAVENDLFTETDEAVQPEKAASRLWAATTLVKALGLEKEAKALNNTKLPFKDAKNIPAGSVGYVAVALAKGIVTGYNDNTFRPNQPVTRAELAAFLDRTDDEMPDHDAQAITGKLKAAVTGNKLTVVKADNSEVTLEVDANVFVFREDRKVGINALQAGDSVLVRTYMNKVVFIEVVKEAEADTTFTQTGKLLGLIVNEQGKLTSITLMNEVDGQDQIYVFSVAPDVKIIGNAASLTNGVTVELKGKDRVVQSIQVKQ